MANDITKFLYRIVGFFFGLSGTIMFYNGFTELLLTFFKNDITTQLIIGFGMLIISFVVFKRDINILK